MKRLAALMVCATFLTCTCTTARAVDIKMAGQWLIGFGVGQSDLMSKYRVGNSKHHLPGDKFTASQRVRLQLEAVANENLSGVLAIQAGSQTWGQKESGAAIGAGDTSVAVRFAYLDWTLPDAPLKVRMGLQPLALPNAAGGSAIMDTNIAAVTASYRLNETIGVTAFWARPLNDNYPGKANPKTGNISGRHSLDNMDLFSLIVPINLDGYEISPWAMYGFRGKNAFTGIDGWQGFQDGYATSDGNIPFTIFPYPEIIGSQKIGDTNKLWASTFWAGLPLTVTAFDPLAIELDLNYGYSEPMGRYWAYKPASGEMKHASTGRQGWLAKALLEYKLAWVVPGIFGWYASGDDSNPKNGSERMPTLVPMGAFTSFLGDGNLGWMLQDYALDYAGTWGVGFQARNMAFIEDISHTFRATWWGGTNSPGMIKYMTSAYAWNSGWGSNDSPYLTTRDALLEFNLISSYQAYENLELNMELDYLANFMDHGAWKKAGYHNTGFSKKDAWKIQMAFAYSF